MACSNCYNGCAHTTPDKCVKYTGVDVPELNIENGDTLFSVEDNIILKILDMIVGNAIIPSVFPSDICSQLQDILPPTTPYTLNDYIRAFSIAICENIDTIQLIIDELQTINSDYTPVCLTIDPGDIANTHIVLQKVIDYLCNLRLDVDAIALDLSTNYVKISDINSYIAAYISSVAPSNLISSKMIPFVAVEYYGTLANFNASGAGTGLWDKVYLCNGSNGTPDKRGRVPVGVTTVTGGGAYNPAVDPGNPDNPNYTINVPLGTNTVTLTTLQIPPHTHTPTVTVTDPKHSHTIPATGHNASSPGSEFVLNPGPGVYNTASVATGITVAVTNANTGGGDPHSNIQPVLPCYYIMYIP